MIQTQKDTYRIYSCISRYSHKVQFNHVIIHRVKESKKKGRPKQVCLNLNEKGKSNEFLGWMEEESRLGENIWKVMDMVWNRYEESGRGLGKRIEIGVRSYLGQSRDLRWGRLL